MKKILIALIFIVLVQGCISSSGTEVDRASVFGCHVIENCDLTDDYLNADLLVTGTVPLVYGELYVYNNLNDTVINAQMEYVKFIHFDTVGESSHTTPSIDDSHIRVERGGVYFLSSSIHAESAAPGGVDLFSWVVMANDGTEEFHNLHSHRDLGGGGEDRGSVSVSGFIRLDAGDTVEMWVANDTNGSDVRLSDITLSIIQVGR